MDVSKELGQAQKFFWTDFSRWSSTDFFLVPLLESCEKLTNAKGCIKGKGVSCTKAMVG